ncbi:MAG: hypothetical protein LBD91_03110 [Prevotellaceae bacterium]|jgi:hypothetical protein|nr:hypothetical protein [Prevotellaceae bacterium]
MEENVQETPLTYCGKTVEEIRLMRMRHGHLFVVTVKDGDQAFHAICKEPTIQVIEAASAIAKTSEIKGAMTIYDNCIVEAEEEIKGRDMLKLQVAAAIGLKTEALKTDIKNV